MPPTRNWREFFARIIDEHGPPLALSAACVVIACLSLFALNNIPSGLASAWVTYSLTGVLVAALATAILSFVVHLIRKRAALSVIAWSGFEERHVLRGSRIPQYTIRFLEYVRGIGNVTKLKLHKRYFDVVVVDVEYVPRLERSDPKALLPIYKLNLNIEPDAFISGIRSLVPNTIAHSVTPIRWGLNDIVISDALLTSLCAPGTDPRWSHFSLEKLLAATQPNGARIALWNWYLPTLLSLALTTGRPLTQARTMPIDEVKRLTSLIAQHADRFFLFNEPRVATAHFRDGDISVLLGGGSTMLPTDRSTCATPTRGIIPSEGAFIWIECAGLLTSDNQSVELAKRYVQHLLTPAAQHELCSCDQYRAFPVTQAAMKEIWNERADPYNLERIMTGGAYRFREDKAALRTLPEHWYEWEGIWEEMLASKNSPELVTT